MRLSPGQMAFAAAALSAIVPGFGHFLIRAWARGAIWLGGWLVLSAITGGGHGPALVVLMAVAAVDAYVMAPKAPKSAPEGSPREGGR